jgi:Mlc titration factor MtfA (ptsG expression regulator)
MIDREINAFYESGAIYVTNDQEDEMDMIDDIIHELAHAVETNNQEIIYGNGKLQREFKVKRRKLFSILEEMYDVPSDFLNDIEYNEQIDDFLYKKVGYDILNQIVTNIFVSGYAATSVSEYFARGFEEYFVGNKDEVKKLSPILYNIIEELVNLED